MTKIFSLILFLTSQSLLAQNYAGVIRETNVEELNHLAGQWEKEYLEEKARAVSFCEAHGYPTVIKDESGNIISEVAGFDENGMIQYHQIDNLVAAKSISTDKVQPGGLPNFNLSGNGVYAGVWDGGAVRLTHDEFNGRVTFGNNVGITDHATHVAGTMVATGVNPGAKGMAIEANLISWDWNNDASEMSSQAANGMLISNHSYGNLAGWSFGSFSGNSGWHWFGNNQVSVTEDYRYGFYSSASAQRDLIQVNAPFYLIVKSSGNQRNTGPAPGGQHWALTSGGTWFSSNQVRINGPYDCSRNPAEAKNSLIIGAVNDVPAGYQGPSSVTMSSFSSWGPTDDGRIKPDLVGNGVSVLSSIASSNSAYAGFNGTSMATPNVSGSLMLLQEHYSNLNSGNYMKASTLKGLAIHTADECGTSPGPDYAFGWGLTNIHKAAQYISDDSIWNVIIEKTLSNTSIYSISVLATGNEPLKASICYMDQPGAVSAPALNNRTPKLVNDLDLRIIGTGTTMPWKLDPNNPSSAATKGDNIVDNVEVVTVDNPTPGLYTIQVSHKGTLVGGSQNFSLIVSGILAGDTSDHCRPLVDFSASSGKFSDGSGASNYSNNQDCMWQIENTGSAWISLDFESLDLENNADFIRVYDGNSTSDPLLGTFTGSNLPPIVFSTGDKMLVHFVADGVDAGNLGFTATYGTPCKSFEMPSAGFLALLTGDSCGHEVRFFNQSNKADSVFWDFGDGTTGSDQGSTFTHVFPNGGDYDVTQFAYNDCSSYDSLIQTVAVQCITGLNGFSQNIFTKVFPNPSKGGMILEWEREQLLTNIDISDAQGKTILQFSTGLGSGKLALNLKEFGKGLYLMNLVFIKGSKTIKLIIE
jgi:Subtilase family/CUB domain/Secretion system C-terminal sorting domain/PKD domain